MMRPQNDRHDYGGGGSKIFNELSALVMSVIRSPPPPAIGFSDQDPAIQPRRRSGPSLQQITPAGLASLLLGISLSLMMCGSLTFVIGIVLMPWVIVMVMFLYLMGVVSSISIIGRAILFCFNNSPAPKDDCAAAAAAASAWKLL